MAVDVKLQHIVSDNNLIKVVHRFVLSPILNVAATKVYRFLEVLFILGKRFFCGPQLPEKYVEYMMSCPALSVSRNSLKHKLREIRP